MTNHLNRSTSAKLARAYVAAKNGVKRVKITNDGQVHAYGVMVSRGTAAQP